jgi:xylulokinase
LSHVLAVDLGTGTAKVALVAADGAVAASAMRPIETVTIPGGGVEQDPAGWWSAVRDAAREALAQAALAPGDVEAVACTTQWAVTVPVAADGAPIGRAISWMDSRGAPHVRELVGGRLAGYNARRLRRFMKLSAGVPVLSGNDGLGHVLHLKHAEPQIYAAAHKLLEPADWLNHELTGEFRATAGTMFPYWLTDNRDPARIDYDAGLLKLAGVDRAKLADLVAPESVIGGLTETAAAELGLGAGTPVIAGTTDLQAATVGAGAIEPGQGYFYVGTTSWLSCHVPAKRSDLRHMLTTMPAALPGRYVVVAEQGMAGRCLEWLRETLVPGGYDELMALAADVAPGSDGLIFTPWLGGVSVPVDDGATHSAFLNQTWRTTRGHYVRAVMEGIAYNLRWLRPHVERFARTRFEELTFIGGAAQSDLWCQICADVLDVPIRRVAEPRLANAVGCGLLAFAALGRVEVSELAARSPTGRVFTPDAAAVAAYDRGFVAFRGFYRANRRVYRRLKASA